MRQTTISLYVFRTKVEELVGFCRIGKVGWKDEDVQRFKVYIAERELKLKHRCQKMLPLS